MEHNHKNEQRMREAIEGNDIESLQAEIGDCLKCMDLFDRVSEVVADEEQIDFEQMHGIS